MNRLIEFIINPEWNWYILTVKTRAVARELRCRIGKHDLVHYRHGDERRAYCLQSNHCRGKVHFPDS